MREMSLKAREPKHVIEDGHLWKSWSSENSPEALDQTDASDGELTKEQKPEAVQYIGHCSGRCRFSEGELDRRKMKMKKRRWKCLAEAVNWYDECPKASSGK